MERADLKALLKRVVELAMPNLRAYYRVTRKARVVKTYASDGRYWADVQPLRNDESDDPTEPVVAKVEIPVIWAGPQRGIIGPPAVGSRCDLSYYDGDPNYPRISNFRWQGNGAPVAAIGELVIQCDPETYIRIDAQKRIVHVTPADMANEIGGSKDEAIGANWTIQVGGVATIAAPQIVIEGNLSVAGSGGGSGEATITGNLTVDGSITATGSIIDTGGNTNHHSHDE